MAIKTARAKKKGREEKVLIEVDWDWICIHRVCECTLRSDVE